MKSEDVLFGCALTYLFTGVQAIFQEVFRPGAIGPEGMMMTGCLLILIVMIKKKWYSKDGGQPHTQ